MRKINFITSNAGKVQSLHNALAARGLNVAINTVSLDIIEPQFDTVQAVSQYKALTAFKTLKEPVLVEDGGLSLDQFNGFPGVYTKYVIKTIGADGVLKLMNGVKNRTARFVSTATFINSSGAVFQFDRTGGDFEIVENKVNIQSPFAWSELWQILYSKTYGKTLCELSAEELSDYSVKADSNSSIAKFANWYVNNSKNNPNILK